MCGKNKAWKKKMNWKNLKILKKKERKNDVKKNQWIFKNLKKKWILETKRGMKSFFFRYPQPSYDIKSNEIRSVQADIFLEIRKGSSILLYE